MTSSDKNTQWDTPPDGDFARYVERLNAADMSATTATANTPPPSTNIPPSLIQPHGTHTRLPSATEKVPPKATRTSSSQQDAADKVLSALQGLRLFLVLAVAVQILWWWNTRQIFWPLLGATVSLSVVLSVLLKIINTMLKRRSTQADLQALAQSLALQARKNKKP